MCTKQILINYILIDEFENKMEFGIYRVEENRTRTEFWGLFTSL